jgi:hypothetical protein
MENDPTTMQIILGAILTGAGVGIGLTLGYGLVLFLVSDEVSLKINLLYWLVFKRKKLKRIKKTPIFVGDRTMMDDTWYIHLGYGYFKPW